MHLNYSITTETYAQMLYEMIRQRDKKPWRVAFYILLIFALLICGRQIIQDGNLTGDKKKLLLVITVGLLFLNLLYYGLRKKLCQWSLHKMIQKGQICKEYWDEHRISLGEDLLTLSYGGIELNCAYRSISRICKLNCGILLYSGEKVFEFIPFSAFLTEDTIAKFDEEIRAHK